MPHSVPRCTPPKNANTARRDAAGPIDAPDACRHRRNSATPPPFVACTRSSTRRPAALVPRRRPRIARRSPAPTPGGADAAPIAHRAKFTAPAVRLASPDRPASRAGESRPRLARAPSPPVISPSFCHRFAIEGPSIRPSTGQGISDESPTIHRRVSETPPAAFPAKSQTHSQRRASHAARLRDLVRTHRTGPCRADDSRGRVHAPARQITACAAFGRTSRARRRA